MAKNVITKWQNVITNVTKSTRKLSLRAYSVQLLKKKELKTTRHELFWSSGYHNKELVSK